MTHARPRAPRFKVGLTLVYDTGEEFWSAPVSDASESGVFVETHHVLEIGKRVTLMPDVPSDERLPFEIRAIVARVNEYDPDNHWSRTPGIAFRFVDMQPRQIEEVRTFLMQHGVLVR